MLEPTDPQLAAARREILAEMTPLAWAQWMHNPITAAFFQYQEDMIAYARTVAADLLEAGAYRLGEAHEDRNPDVVRGKLLAMRQLHGIKLEEIQAFYTPEESPAEHGPEGGEEDHSHEREGLD